MKDEEESENTGLKLKIIKTEIMNLIHHFMANSREKSGSSDIFYSPGLQNHYSGDCSHEIKSCLHLGRKAMTNLDSILKSRDIFLPTKSI